MRSRKNDELTTLRARLAKTIGEWRTKTRQCTELHHQLDAAATAIVYFGEYVPKDRVAQAYSLVDDAEALLVAGSSLAVLSSYRFVRHAAARGIPIAIVNRGPTRSDDLATVKIDGGCSRILTVLADELTAKLAPRS